MELYSMYQNFITLVREKSDPRTRHWFLANDDPIYVFMCTALYLMFVCLGPKFMRNRHPFELRNFMIAYNTFLVGLSVYMVYEIWVSAYLNSYDPVCQSYTMDTWRNPKEMRMAKVLWWYFFSKLIEFMDTIIMVLRKKNEQITFLHVFHHASMLNIWWFSIMLIPGGQSWFASSINSLVHVVMYTYYLLNLFPSMRKHLWWKKYITQFQLTQFVVILLHTSYTLIGSCDFPPWGSIMLIAYMFIMLVLFGNFYKKSYAMRGRPSEKLSYSRNGDHSIIYGKAE